MHTHEHRVGWLFLLSALLATAACGSTESRGGPCGEGGDAVESGGGTYCVYRGGIVIETGFECPAALPFRSDFGMDVICSDRDPAREGVPPEVCTRVPAACVDVDAGPRDAGEPSCAETPCVRANECVATCEGPVLYEGCCACEPGTFDRVTECGPLDAGPCMVECAAPPPGCSYVGPVTCDPPRCPMLECSDAGPPGLPDGATCTADFECASGLCYGTADMSGAFAPPTCQSACLPMDDRTHYCRNDSHCCGGAQCSLGSGELEGLCRAPTGTLAEGESCGDGLATCGAGLSCCYPCGIPGCTNVCEPTCTEGSPGCSGGCMLRP